MSRVEGRHRSTSHYTTRYPLPKISPPLRSGGGSGRGQIKVVIATESAIAQPALALAARTVECRTLTDAHGLDRRAASLALFAFASVHQILLLKITGAAI